MLYAIIIANINKIVVHGRGRRYVPSVRGGERHRPAVEHHPGRRGTSVGRIADNRAPAKCQMDPYLVGAAGQGPGLQEGRPTPPCNDPE